MKAVTFSKTDKIKIITFVLVVYSLPWLFYPWVKQGGEGDIFGIFMMILPTSGVVLGRSICERKIRGWLHWLYIVAFAGFTLLMILCTTGVISWETAYNTGVVLMVLSVALLLGSLIDEKELYPFKNGKNVIGIFLIYVVVMEIANLLDFIHAEPLNIAAELFYQILYIPVSVFVLQSICLFGEEYAWRGCLQGRLQTIFGKRMGVIILGIVWELWHMPLWFSVYEFNQERYFVLLILVRMLHTVGKAVFFGWAYMKTKNIWLCVLLHGFNNSAAYGFNWIPGIDTSESFSVFDAITAAISAVIMLFFLFAKEYRKEVQG